MKEKLNKYFLLQKYSFYSFEDIDNMFEYEIDIMVKEIKKQIK